MTTLIASPGNATQPDQQALSPQVAAAGTPARENEDWRTQAVCKDDPEPDRWVDLPQVVIKGHLNPAYDAHVAELAAVCSTCTVRDACLGEALAMNVRGVFAGEDEFDRADIRESLGLPTPPMMPPPETDDDARLIEQQFTALRLARRGLNNKQIAATLGVSTMTVSRLFASEDRPAKRRTRQKAPADAWAAEDAIETVTQSAPQSGTEVAVSI